MSEPARLEVLADADVERLSAGYPDGDGGLVGGAAIPPPTDEEQISDAIDGSLAGRLAAVGAKLQRTKTQDFPIPDTPLVLRARTFKDHKAYRKGVKTEAFIVRATAGLYLADEDTDELTEIPVWGNELARLLGFRVENASELVRRVLDNPVRLETFAADLIQWMAGRSQEDEQALGE